MCEQRSIKQCSTLLAEKWGLPCSINEKTKPPLGQRPNLPELKHQKNQGGAEWSCGVIQRICPGRSCTMMTCGPLRQAHVEDG